MFPNHDERHIVSSQIYVDELTPKTQKVLQLPRWSLHQKQFGRKDASTKRFERRASDQKSLSFGGSSSKEELDIGSLYR